ncbi:hypothetical protein niasHT_023415 [Heterodera trifolii]|uniref:Methionine synthase reductase n=1 Tax=Heterodera trifolii TaxID=157864 RepID=A0ABD2K4E8_9BILA
MHKNIVFANKKFAFQFIACAFMGHDVPSLKIGAKNLGQVTELSVPAITQPLLSIRIADNEHEKSNSNRLWQCGAPIPTAFGPLLRTRVVRNECVTRTDTGRIGKAKWELELALPDQEDADQQQQRVLLENCDAGDSFNVLFENPEQEVDFVLKRLGFCAETADTEHILELHKVPEINGKFAHFPSRCSPRQLIAQFIDIRRAPSRLALRVFADHAHEPAERRRLLELCSAQGATEFTKFVRQPNISLVELLSTFPSLTPPLASLIECLPRLLPRHYTLCCYLLAQPRQQLRFRFVYSVLQMPPSMIIDECAEFEGQKQQYQQQIRYGACTQWLLQQRPGQTVQIIQKEPSKFRFLPPSFVPSPASMPSSGSTMVDQSDHALLLLNTPLMMVGPGTGVAPFIAFLQKIRHFMQRMGGDGAHCGRVKRVLFYASSNLDDEFLFRYHAQIDLAHLQTHKIRLFF